MRMTISCCLSASLKIQISVSGNVLLSPLQSTERLPAVQGSLIKLMVGGREVRFGAGLHVGRSKHGVIFNNREGGGGGVRGDEG